MPPEMLVSMRRSKLKAEEAALLAGEVEKPSWESRNEGIHERVSFEDTIWGFDLAGGAYYRTPLRVTFVKPDSRAEKAGIRAGDKLLNINGIDTSTLTIQEAHDIIIKSGIHLVLTVTAPEDTTDAVYYYEDPLEEDPEEEERRRLEEEMARKRQVHAKVNHNWSLQWPWVSKRKIIWRESNCYLVPSKYEEKHRDKFPPRPMIRTSDDVVLYSAKDTSKNRYRRQPSIETRRESYHFDTDLLTGDRKQSQDDEKRRISNRIDDTVYENGLGDEESEETELQDEEAVKINGQEETESEEEENSHSNHEDIENSSVEKVTEKNIYQNGTDDDINDNHQSNEKEGVEEENITNGEVDNFDELSNHEISNETTYDEVIENVLSNNDIKDEENNNVESIVGSGENSSEKKLE